MATLEQRRRRLVRVFPTDQADLLAEVITEAYEDLVKTGDFNELKGIVGELAEAQKELVQAQKRTEQGLDELRGTVGELAEAQKRTEQGLDDLRGVLHELAVAQAQTSKEVRELAVAQAQTSKEVRELAVAQAQTSKEVRELAIGLGNTRRDLGGLTQSMGYAMENEAYRMLPSLLQARFGISLTQKLLRKQVGDQEIDLIGEGTKDGKAVLVVGEVKLRLDARWRKDDPTLFDDLQEKVEAVRQEYPGLEIIPLIVAHFARPAFLDEAEKRGVAVIQSFEW